MERTQPTTPFGRRPLSLAMMAAQAAAKACPPDITAHKWRLFRNLTEAKEAVGLTDRALSVLNALLTFHPETALTPGPDLVVFPSNRELSVRAHGMTPATLRRHLAALVEAGVVIRRDSPNGKRYARKGEGGQIEQAFGFDLSPLLARAAEFEALANQAREEGRARHLLREEISLHRRDIAKTVAAALEEGLPGAWAGLGERLWQLGSMPPRSAASAALQPLADALRALRADVDKLLAEHTKTEILSSNESQLERHQQNSNTESPAESEPGFRESQGRTDETRSAPERTPAKAYPLSMVLQACPDITMYARHGIVRWRDFLATADLVRSALGISPSAWAAAVEAMGEEEAAVTVAAILQRASMIKSPGGYLRDLTEKASAGRFSAWPMVLALHRVSRGDAG